MIFLLCCPSVLAFVAILAACAVSGRISRMEERWHTKSL